MAFLLLAGKPILAIWARTYARVSVERPRDKSGDSVSMRFVH